MMENYIYVTNIRDLAMTMLKIKKAGSDYEIYETKGVYGETIYKVTYQKMKYLTEEERELHGFAS